MSLIQNGKYNVLIKKITRAQFDLFSVKLFPVLLVSFFSLLYIHDTVPSF